MKVWKEKCEGQEHGYIIYIQVGDKTWQSYWSSPPSDCSHVGIEYLNNRYPIIKTEKRASEFKRQFKKLWIEVSEHHMELMKHALGLTYKKKPYRNYFFTNENDEDWNALVEKGLAIKGTKKPNNDNNIYFWLSKDGIEFVIGKKMTEKQYEDL